MHLACLISGLFETMHIIAKTNTYSIPNNDAFRPIKSDVVQRDADDKSITPAARHYRMVARNDRSRSPSLVWRRRAGDGYNYLVNQQC